MKPASPGPLTSLAIFVGLASAAIGSPDRHERIVNGADATVGQFPHQVSIRNTKYNKHKCGGAIIHSRWIVSAAFCTPDAYDLKYVAVVGSMELQGGGITYAILGVTNHPDFRPPNLQNDISLLHTAEPIRFGEVIQPIALPTVNTTANANAIISGWGSLKFPPLNQNADVPNHLQFLCTQIIDHAECAKVLEPFPNLVARVNFSTVLCTQAKDAGICKGDIGGPLITLDYTLVGIASWKIDCAQGYPDAFTNVVAYIDFIQQTIGDTEMWD